MKMNRDVPEIGIPSVTEIEEVVPHSMNVSVKTCTLLGCFMYCACVFGLLVVLHCSRPCVLFCASTRRAQSVQLLATGSTTAEQELYDISSVRCPCSFTFNPPYG
jgi:hypothetical protein